MVQTKQWYESWTLWVNVLSVLAVGITMSLQLAGQLALTDQEIAIGTVALALVNAIIRVVRTNQPIDGSPAHAALVNTVAAPIANPSIPPQPGQSGTTD